MNTHLLIPIKDIENQIKNLMNSKIENQINGVRISILQNVLKGKQISLDEKDIDAKAETYANKQVDASMRASDIPYTKKGEELWAESKEDYTQALKDLL